jgi:predicted lipid-binding transport protein (Tim44 family)
MDKDKVKNVRRAAKGTLTRAFSAYKELIDAQRPVVEVKEAFDVVKNAYNSLEVKHEEFTVLLDDTQYDEAEQWMQACNSEYMTFSMMYNDYLNANVTENEKDDVINQANEDENNANVDGT